MLVVHHTFYEELHLRQPEAVNLVQALLVIAVRREETVLTVARESDSEVVPRPVKRCAEVVQVPYQGVLSRRVRSRLVEVQTAVARVTVRREIQRSVLVQVRVHLVGTRVDAFT